MRYKFTMKYNTAFALQKHKVIKIKKRILALISDWLKRKLEEMIWENFHKN